MTKVIEVLLHRFTSSHGYNQTTIVSLQARANGTILQCPLRKKNSIFEIVLK